MIRFVTGNEGKVAEAREYLPTEVEQVEYDYAEVQSDDLETIVRRGAREAYEELGAESGIFVDDTGLFVEALDGFPGPYSAYVEDTLGIERVWELVENESNRKAAFRTVLAYYDGDDLVTFEGSVRGRIVAPRGEDGFGYDPIFEHDGSTFAELSTEEKNAISHRGRALAAFADWLAEQE
ncbi:XTP/dITP diphosphohydrolase [Natronoarchaeum philippinense]|uniref:XTP/dITP diphosphohydrolase n=1 Tax=Natronoarchaeum philippinense TaxID=558529 RepID=A0A285NRU3_NATPI|nr:XTP/dITP diphosphatase [Natronoarchaeum philippinense]SNZ12205.1 XTP/dITP diphosphohydrolase [Natronoarchaeum philippinense]